MISHFFIKIEINISWGLQYLVYYPLKMSNPPPRISPGASGGGGRANRPSRRNHRPTSTTRSAATRTAVSGDPDPQATAALIAQLQSDNAQQQACASRRYDTPDGAAYGGGGARGGGAAYGGGGARGGGGAAAGAGASGGGGAHQPSHKAKRAFVLITRPGKDGKVRVLIQRRADVEKGGLPGGERDRSDQSAAHTAARETYEETGFRIDSSNLMRIGTILGAAIFMTEFPSDCWRIPGTNTREVVQGWGYHGHMWCNVTRSPSDEVVVDLPHSPTGPWRPTHLALQLLKPYL